MNPRARKRWGQHFLTDKNLLHKLVRIIDPKADDIILEIGPGEGTLTEILAPKVKKLVGIEVDPVLFQSLTANETLKNCDLIHEDFLKFDLKALSFGRRKIRVVGNIPYNITTPIMFKLLEYKDKWQDIYLMVQREIADRLLALPGGKDYGRLTVMVQLVMSVRKELLVPPDVFVPKPKVRSAFISLAPHGKYELDEITFTAFSAIVKTAFSQRRKMLKNSLKEYRFHEDFLPVSTRSGKQAERISLARRPETLSVEDFLTLASGVVRES